MADRENPLVYLAALLYGYPYWALTRLSPRTAEIVDYESKRWAHCLGWHSLAGSQPVVRLSVLAIKLPEYRSLLEFRIRHFPFPVRMLCKMIWRGEATLDIYCGSIDKGLFIQHGFATTITAESVGRDCWINQQVTIGHNRHGLPRIGDNVSIGAGAVVVGPISIGDNVKIGVNATIVKDVAPGQTMVAPHAVNLERMAEPQWQSQSVQDHGHVDQ